MIPDEKSNWLLTPARGPSQRRSPNASEKAKDSQAHGGPLRRQREKPRARDIMPYRSVLTLLIALLASSASRAVALDFDRDVAPIFAAYCLDCHSGAEPKGKLDLSHRERAMAGGKNGKVIVAGDINESPMWELVDTAEMPPKKELPRAHRETIKTWISQGAKWGSDPIDPYRFSTEKRAGYDWWSLQPIKRPEVPRTGRIDSANGWAINPIDAFVLARLGEKKLSPSPIADRRTLIRRLYFDLIR